MANPNTINNLMNNRDAIRRIMAMDANGTMDRMVENARNNGTLTAGNEGDITYNAPERQNTQPQQIVVNETTIKNHARMPKQILESFQKNPGQDVQVATSVLDGLNIPQPTKPVVKESTQNAAATAQIDYSLLKTIINEAVQENVKKYVGQMYKKLVAEQKNNTVAAIKISENGFSLIDEQQNIYSCKPQFKRNIMED